MSERYEFTLVGNACDDALASTRPLRTFRAMPLTASSELRASAELRRLSDRLISEHPRLEWYEVLCQPAEPSPEAGEIPAVALLDSRLPILICLYGSSAFFSVDAELTRSSARKAFRIVDAYVRVLRDCGYAVLVDHASDVVSPLAADQSSVSARLLLAGEHRWFGRLQFDTAAWFFVSSIGFIILVLAYSSSQPERRSLAEVVFIGCLVGAALAVFQYSYERNQLRDRLREMRDILVTTSGRDEPLRFSVPSVWPGIVTTVGLLGGLAVMGWASGERLVPIFLAASAIVAVAYLFFCRRAYVLLDTNGIEGLGVPGRRYLPLEEVDGVEQTSLFECWTVRSAARGTIWIPRKLAGREQLIEVLTERVLASWKATVAESAPDDDALAARVEEELRRARRRRWFGSDLRERSKRPIWLWLMRHHPLRAQYDWTGYLLRRGHVRIAHVVSPPNELMEPEGDRSESTHALLLAVADSRGWQGGPALSAAIDEVATSDDELGDSEIEQYCLALRRNAGFPLMLRVPPNLAQGCTVYCTSALASRRDIPLGCLRSTWLPVLIDPRACPFAIVVPVRYWGPVVRRLWKGASPV